MTKKTVDLPVFGGTAEIRASSFNEAENTVDIIWTTGASVRRYSYYDDVYYNEILEVSDDAVLLDRLNAGAPFLNTHDSSELKSVIGAVVPGTARIENGIGLATIRLSRADADADIVQKIKDGIIRNISVGYRILAVEKSGGQNGEDEDWRVTKWEPLELSAVPIPADPGAQVRGQKQGVISPCEFVIAPPARGTKHGQRRANMRLSQINQTIN